VDGSADWKSAIQQVGNLYSYVQVAQPFEQAGMPVPPWSVHGKNMTSQAQKVLNHIDRPVTKHPQRRPERVPL